MKTFESGNPGETVHVLDEDQDEARIRKAIDLMETPMQSYGMKEFIWETTMYPRDPKPLYFVVHKRREKLPGTPYQFVDLYVTGSAVVQKQKYDELQRGVELRGKLGDGDD